MPITKSAIDSLRKDKRRMLINKPTRSAYKIKLALARKNPTLKTIREAFSSLDKAARKKIIHKNKSSRLKSGLTRLQKIKKG